MTDWFTEPVGNKSPVNGVCIDNSDMHDKILDTKLQEYANSIIHQRKSWSTRLKNHNSDMSHYISNINPLYKVKVVKHHAYNLSVVKLPCIPASKDPVNSCPLRSNCDNVLTRSFCFFFHGFLLPSEVIQPSPQTRVDIRSFWIFFFWNPGFWREIIINSRVQRNIIM